VTPSSGAKAALGLLVVLAGLWGAGAAAQEPADEPVERSAWSRLREQTSIGGSLRAAYWSSSRNLDTLENLPVAALWLHGRWDPDRRVSLYVDGWVRNDDLFIAQATSGKFREGYLDLHLGAFDIRLGRQIIAWGRADQINPTDNLTPRNFTLLVPEDADERSGTTGAKVVYHVGDLSLTGIVLPTFEPDVIALQRPPSGSTLRERVPGDPVTQGAFKIEQTGGRVDWSLSYFDGYDLFPDLGIDTVRPDGVDFLLRHHRIRVVGADAAAAIGPYTVRGEVAYTFTQHEHTGDQIKSPFLLLVLGADRTLPGGLYVNVQYLLRVISSFQDPLAVTDPIARQVAIQQASINDQLDPVKHGVAVRLSRTWLNETLVTEISSIVSPARAEFVLRPKVKYAVTDHLKLTAGADIFRGETPSFFGRLRDTSTAYVEARWDF
jgi:hypothetical protein